MLKQPNPGSDAAVEKGCTCPRIDNNHGLGTFKDHVISFIIAYDCPIHQPPRGYKHA